MNFKILIASLVVFITGCTNTPLATPQTQQTADPVYEYTEIADNLYRARSDNHFTVFMVTAKGTILGDPLNLQFAEWLKQQLAEQFNSEVVYVLYSHHHWDHASGGTVFADTARYIGHENMIEALQAPLPANYAVADASGNGDGFLQREEAAGGAANRFDFLDENGDGNVSGAEFNRDIVSPDATYSDTYTIYLDNQTVDMIYAGLNHSNDATILYFGEAAAAFAVDWLVINSLPRTFYGNSLDSWIASIDKIINLNVTHVIPGHGPVGRLEDAVAYRQYLIDLRGAAGAAIAAGMSQQEFVETLSLDAYKDWANYDNFISANAAEAYQMAAQ